MSALTLALLIGTAAADEPVAVADVQAEAVRPAPFPEPLQPRDFQMPATEVRQLSNGLTVVVATREGFPLFDLRLLFRTGAFADPEGQEGLASATFAMLTEGAGDLSSEALSRELKRLGSDVSAWADDDGSGVVASGLVRNLEPTLDLWSTVLLEPIFPAREWEIQRNRRIANLRAAREDPSAVAMRVYERVMWGSLYRGRAPTAETLQAIGPEDMARFHQGQLGPDQAILLVAGGLTADEIVPLLEARIGTWAPDQVATPSPEVEVAAPERPVLFLVDHPDAAQSVVRVATFIGSAHDDDHHELLIANTAFGGAFSGRVNMNLRETHNYTYGARCVLGFRHGPGIWTCGASVETSVTGPALHELRSEIEQVLGERPLTADEVDKFREGEIHGFPMGYERVSAVLGEQARIWRFGLPEDYPEQYVPRMREVTAETANQALRRALDPQRMAWMVVGDKASIHDDLVGLGFDIIELDRDGFPIEEE